MEAKDFDKTLDFTKIKPYGDTMNDGKVQLSFTLPVPCGAEAVEAAKQLLRKMGLENPSVVFYKELTPGFTFFNCYGSCTHTVDYSTIYVPKVESNTMDMYETDEYIKENIGRKIVIVGASTGTDAHTVGIDAIMNMKGYAGHYGLERYEMIEAYNLGSQVPNDEFIAKGIELHADALLVSHRTPCRRPARLADGDPEGRPHQEHDRVHRADGGRGPARQDDLLLWRRPRHPRARQGARL